MTQPKASSRQLRSAQATEAALKQGIRLFQAGRHDEAERAIRGILITSPDHPDALQTLGMIAAHKGHTDQAERLLRKCIALAPKHAAAHINLGNVLIGANNVAEAAVVYQRAVELAPRLPAAHYNLGRCLRALGRLDDAMSAYRRALKLDPDFFEACVNLGSALCEQESYQEAETLYRKLLARRPDLLDLKVYLGDVLRLRGQPDQARALYDSLLLARPEHPRARLSLSLALLDENDVARAAELLGPLQAEGTLPRHEILSALAALRFRQGDKQKAIANLTEAVNAGGNHPQQYLTLATWLADIRQRDRAVAVLEQSLARFGDRPSGLLGQLVLNQRHLCDWREWPTRLPALVERIRHGKSLMISPFAALALPGLKPVDLLKVSRDFTRSLNAWTARALPPRPLGPPAARVRIGYLSADFHEHATAYLTAALFERHDREAFELFAYSWGPDDASPIRQRLLEAFEHFTDIRALSHTEAAQRIRDDGIDILIDLKGYTRDARTEILALRPCPIQVNWLGFPGSLGAPFLDYIIVDPVVVPEDQSPHYDEALAYLPDAYAPVDDRRRLAPTPTRAEAGLPESGFVFCCFNNPYKITPEIFDRWCGLLREVPDSVLWLFASNDKAPDNLVREAAARGIGPERLVFAPKLPQDEHLARLALADLCLDTLPYNAHTTASDALWVGVPMLTCVGETFPGRVAASLLTAAGMPELIVDTLDAYERQASHLATHPEALAAIRRKLQAAKQSAAFYSTERFARNLESLYRRMLDRSRQELPPALLHPIQADV
ncbi:tetratricopeptide repeat protein [Thiocystis minor]|uniref:tetratricopeptide repeat protein n=1 Tax=Thiocystis minor TaxID=61597 RepID=UPI0019136A35|nr:glycosyltransferase family 41 protein [Thiocystis minor]